MITKEKTLEILEELIKMTKCEYSYIDDKEDLRCPYHETFEEYDDCRNCEFYKM